MVILSKQDKELIARNNALVERIEKLELSLDMAKVKIAELDKRIQLCELQPKPVTVTDVFDEWLNGAEVKK